MSAATPTHSDDTWHKVHGEFVETMIHRCELIVGPLAGERDTAGPNGSAASLPAVVAHAERMRALAEELVDLGRPAPLDQLEAIAGLTSTERELVALAAAFELDPSIGEP